MEQTATLTGGKWYVGLTRKDTNCKMPDSYPNALVRLKGVERKIQRNNEHGERYVGCINHLFTNYFANRIHHNIVTPRTWYIAHFGFDIPIKNKLRWMFDAAHKNGLYLNGYLYKALDLLMSLLGMMLRLSENRITITGAEMELKRSIQGVDQEVLQNVAANNTVSWTFVPVSPHWGGAWERLIRTFKDTLKVILKERLHREVTRRITQRQADMFWKRWVKEVLPNKIKREKWQAGNESIQVGDLVVIIEPGGSRILWSRGIFQQTFPGFAGRLRMVEVKTRTCKKVSYTRRFCTLSR